MIYLVDNSMIMINYLITPTYANAYGFFNSNYEDSLYLLRTGKRVQIYVDLQI